MTTPARWYRIVNIATRPCVVCDQPIVEGVACWRKGVLFRHADACPRKEQAR